MTTNGVEKFELITQEELAKMLRVSEGYLKNQRWKKEGIPYVKIGSKVFYDREDVMAWVRRTKVKK